MRHIKSYKLFESIKGELVFPNKFDIEEIFFDVTDEGITDFTLQSFGYLYFPYLSLNAARRSNLHAEMVDNPENWENQKPEELMGDTWGDLFLDLSDSRNKYMLEKSSQYLELDEVIKRIRISKLNKMANKPFLEVFLENIENGKVRAYPFINLVLNSFESKYLDNVIECLERLYDMTGYRPVREIWTDDHVDEYHNIKPMIFTNLYLFKLSDIEYKNLTSVFSDRSVEKEVVKKFL